MFPGGMGNMQAMMKKVQKMQADMAISWLKELIISSSAAYPCFPAISIR